MRLAAIDIGTNSVHMIVVQVRPDLSFEIIDREKDMVRLGAGGLGGRRLTDEAMAAGLQALAKFKRLADSHGVDEIIAGATSATREAENGGDFLGEISRQTGIHPLVITGPEEARLIHLAAAYGTDLEGGKAVVVDIGGGSVEITHGASRAQVMRSFKLGVIRVTERFVKSDPISARDERRLVRHIEEETGTFLAQLRRRGFRRVIGTSGTILSLGALASAQESGKDVSDVRGLRVGTKAFHKLRKSLSDMDLRSRLAVPGMDPRRADLAVGGVILFDTLLRGLGAKEFVLCDLALREGLVLDYVHRNAAHIAQVDRFPDIRRRSAVELAERCRYHAGHAAHVTSLALSIFDQAAEAHGLGAREREWLDYAGLLHDVGTVISHEGHHKHSQYLIKNGGLRGFDPEEIDVLSLVARYHRSGAPRKGNREFARLGGSLRRAVRVLSAILAIAESLDRSHAEVVTGVDVQVTPDTITLKLKAVGDSELESWATARHLPQLEKVLGRPVRLESPAPETPELSA